MKRETTCCFTGPRPPRLPAGGREDAPEMLVLKEKLDAAVRRAYDDGYRVFIDGMAEGFDLLAAEAVLKLREEHPDVHLMAAFPAPESRKNHSAEVCERIERIVAKASIAVYAYTRYEKGCELRRNLYMVSRAGRIIGYYNGLSSGTAHCWNQAQLRGLETVNLYGGEAL